jgi:hypothetical protein
VAAFAPGKDKSSVLANKGPAAQMFPVPLIYGNSILQCRP